MSHFSLARSFQKLRERLHVLSARQILGLIIWFLLKKMKFAWFSLVNRTKGFFAIRKIGRDVKFNGVVRFENSFSNITFGNSSMVGIGCYMQATSQGSISIGERTLINDHCYITSNYGIEIGRNVLIAEFVSIRDFDHEHRHIDVPISLQGLRGGPISIGEGAWIGRGVIVTSGVSIGEGCIIGANSVVTRDIPAWSIAVGSPARVIKSRKPAESMTEDSNN